MTELVPVSSKLEKPLSKNSGRTGHKKQEGQEDLDLVTPWKSAEDLERAVAALPSSVRSKIQSVERKKIPQTRDADILLTDYDQETFNWLFGSKIAYALDQHWDFSTQWQERLRRGEDPKILRREAIQEIDSFYHDQKPPFMDLAYLDDREKEARSEYKNASQEFSALEKRMADLRTKIVELQRQKGTKNQVRELEKEYAKLKKAADSTEEHRGRLDRLRYQTDQSYKAYTELRTSNEDCQRIGKIIKQNAPRVLPKDVADIWVGMIDYIGWPIRLQIGAQNRRGDVKGEDGAKQSLLGIQEILLEAITDWLDTQPKEVQDKKIDVLAKNFAMVRDHLETSLNRDPESIKANLQHAQIILRKLVKLAGK